MAVTADYLLVCDYALATFDEKFCAIGLLASLKAAAFPFMPLNLGFVFRLRGKPGTALMLTLAMVGPDGATQQLLDQTSVTIEGAGIFATMLNAAALVRFESAGTYAFVLTNGDAELARQHLLVVGPPAIQPPSTPSVH